MADGLQAKDKREHLTCCQGAQERTCRYVKVPSICWDLSKIKNIIEINTLKT